jgi:hypothetical protein
MKLTDSGISLGRAISDADTSATTSIMMVVENKEHTYTLSGIEGLTYLTSIASSTELTTSVESSLRERLMSGLSVVKEYVAVKVSAVTGYFDKLFAREVYTHKLCVQKASGENICLTGDEVERVMNTTNQGQYTAPTSIPVEQSNNAGTSTPDVASTTDTTATTTEISNAPLLDPSLPFTEDTTSSQPFLDPSPTTSESSSAPQDVSEGGTI